MINLTLPEDVKDKFEPLLMLFEDLNMLHHAVQPSCTSEYQTDKYLISVLMITEFLMQIYYSLSGTR